MLETANPKTTVFMYGSNMSHARLRRRAPEWDGNFRRMFLPGHELKFNKRLSTGGWAANVVPHPYRIVCGIAIDLTASDLHVMDQYEGCYSPYNGDERKDHYCRKTVNLISPDDNSEIQAVAYVAQRWVTACEDESCRPEVAYLNYVINGARECGLPGDYILEIKRLGEGGSRPSLRRARRNGYLSL